MPGSNFNINYMEALIAFLLGTFIGVLITSLTVFAAFKMVEEKIEQREESEQ